ncbi:NtaA/DmoA family FMN-dependent monooxygenase [Candidatus Entotheonella palauensis]|uniref:NtaA/DmoA family FMN-dependent monooxygenase n=1 Tax=Candidatus Entotheonella palauensis TaxID=93172 RepID=UPI000B7EF381|nr:NtaA/DmoA family FMN-dependent monooxygenase [Candidatus Entotheonella palauensis]
MPKKKKIHLAQFLVHGPSYHSLAMWRHPRTAYTKDNWARPQLYQHIAQVCERDLFDMVFFADLNYISDTFRNSLTPALRYAAQAPEHDPIPLLSWIAAVTKRIGLGATFSTSNQHPFYAARLWATIDHLTGGRAAWNVVTSINGNQQANYGVERESAEMRYDKAHEYIEVCRKLWNSWDEDAVVMDRDNAVFADASKVRRIEHEGRFFKSRGPLNVVRSPQNGPAILQAGTSPKGRDFAAKYADGIFAIQPRAEDAAAYFADIKGRMTDLGRPPEHCRILFGAQPIIGESEDEAREKQDEHNQLVPLDAGMAILSAHLDYDLSQIPLDALMAERTEPELQRMRTRFLKPSGESMTLREVAQRHGQSVGLPQFIGTVKSVADQMEAFIETVGGDGFMLSAIYSPGAIEEFVDRIVPELQRRGLYRTEYRGVTQRELLRQDH